MHTEVGIPDIALRGPQLRTWRVPRNRIHWMSSVGGRCSFRRMIRWSIVDE